MEVTRAKLWKWLATVYTFVLYRQAQTKTPMHLFHRLQATPARLSIAVVVLANLMVLVLAATTLFDSRLQFERQAQIQTRNLAQAVDQDISGSVGKIDLSLATSVGQLEIALARKGLLDPALKDFLQIQENLLPEVEGLRVADAAGRVLLGKGVNAAAPPSINDRAYFQHLRDHGDARLQVSKPFLGRINKKWSLAFVRRFNHRDGSFGGVVFATVSLDHFQSLLSRYDVGAHGVISLRDLDIASIGRFPLSTLGMVQEIGNRNVSREFRDIVNSGVRQSTYHALTAYDQIERTFTFHRMERAPFLLLAGLASDDYLQEWWREVRHTAGFCAVFLLLSLISLRLVRGAFRNVQRETDKIRLILQRASDGIHILDGTGHVVEASDAFCASLGHTKDHMLGMHVSAWDAQWSPDILRTVIFPAALARSVPTTFETRHRRQDGSVIDVEISAVGFDVDEQRFLFASARDITEQKNVKAALAESEQKLRTLFELAPLGIAMTDMAGNYVEFNEAFRQICGYSAVELKTLDYWTLTPRRYELAEQQQLTSLATTGRYGPYEKEYRRKDGSLVPLRLNGMMVTGQDGQQHIWSIVEDITTLRENQVRMESLAYFDPLTNLPNRTLLADRIHQALAQAERHNTLLAVCYLDLDGFKTVNDNWGHPVGDQLLVEVARRLQGCIRAGDTVARLGGDEFVLLLGDAQDIHEVEQAVRRVLSGLSAPLRLGDLVPRLTASIGVAIHPRDGDNLDTLLRHADQAMYVAKQGGKNRFHLFDAENDRRVHEHMEVVSRVEAGLGRGEFCLHYQPKVDMRQGSVVGMEALIRWQHPERGLLLPGSFLPSVDNSECSITLGKWVLREALGQLAAWSALGLNLPISVNISARHLEARDFTADLATLLAEFPAVKPAWLEIEILETTAMEDVDAVSKIISACSNLGVSFALDDFGTGYSSLTYFRRLPTHRLKIDQSFVRDMLDDMDDLAIVEGVIGLARTFQRQVIAEGVETIAHGIPLLQFGCDLAQGYAIARPMPASEVPDWVSQWRVPGEWQGMARTNWSREDFPLLLAGIQADRWIEQLIAVCEGRMSPDQAPPLDERQCHFGLWLHGVGKLRYGGLPIFRTLGACHDRLHALGGELLNLHREHPGIAAHRTGELQAAGHQLKQGLDKLKAQFALPARSKASAP